MTLSQLALTGLVLQCAIAPGFAQNGSAPANAAAASVGQQAVGIVLKKYALDPTVKVEKTGAPLPVNGSWSVGKKAPAVCPELTSGCVQVFYSVPEDDVLCSWTVMLSSDGLTGIVIGQNDAATRFLMRKLSAQDAVEVVAEKNLPVYPAIAVAANVQGDVVLRAVIAEDGTMTSLSVVSGPEMLRYAAEQAARDWKFKPLLVGQRSVRYQVSLTFSFRKFGPASSARVTSLP